ncbi:DUF4271 domain-containing protein [Thermoflavifilum thermophilum]|uniref:DUF4271 domain-containing protein n=1 Tax=Thermoflavifilum thermophilum TaxID=1393122 RepID=A0A1I7NBB6_9BACT|nr:DUF4271 domain-containing protein [Thermoflavifilum thermophilum]SFV31931.1 protein of unknown function [Thermoflavifilum thermophilum]
MWFRFLIFFFVCDGVLLVQLGKAQQVFVPSDSGQSVHIRPGPGMVRSDSLNLSAHAIPSISRPDSSSHAQPGAVSTFDSLQARRVADSLRRDSLRRAAAAIRYHELAYMQWLDSVWTHQQLFRHQDYPVWQVAPLRHRNFAAEQEDDWLFYLCVGYLFLLGFIRSGFYPYFHHVFQAFWHPVMASRKLREQLMQTPFPGLLMNLFFALSMGIYLFLVLRYVHYTTQHQIYLLVAALAALVGIIYLVKYLILQFSGWVFGVRELTAGYAFVLMLVNKVLGVALVPFVLLLAFGTGWMQDVALHLSLVLIAALFVYRYVSSYAWVRQYMVFSRFHFFLYLCAFEVAPVLIMAKIILEWLHGGF